MDKENLIFISNFSRVEMAREAINDIIPDNVFTESKKVELYKALFILSENYQEIFKDAMGKNK